MEYNLKEQKQSNLKNKFNKTQKSFRNINFENAYLS